MKNFGLITMFIAAIALAACANNQRTFENVGSKQGAGAIGGAVLGGLAGSQIGGGSGSKWATGAGVLLGALLGSEIGASLDNADRAAMSQAQTRAYAAPIGEPITWNNPDSGNHGTYTPTRDGYSSSGRYCREYQQEIIVGGQKESAYGKACQQPDGSWEIMS